MGTGGILTFLYCSFDVLFSLYCFTAVEDGGVGLPVSPTTLLPPQYAYLLTTYSPIKLVMHSLLQAS